MDGQTSKWGAPAVGTYVERNQNHGLSSEMNDEELNQAMMDFLSSDSYFQVKTLPISSGMAVDSFKQKQKEDLELFLKKQQEEEQMYLLHK